MTALARLKRDLRVLRNELRRDPRVKFLDVRLVGMSGSTLELQTLVVKADQRGGGAGAMVMDALTRFADAHGLRMILTPSDVYGGDEGRLRAFYGRWGFVPQDEVRMGRDPVRRVNPPRGADERLRRAEQGWLTTQDRADRDAWARELARVGQTWPDDVVMPPDQGFSPNHVSWYSVPPMGRGVSLFLGHERHEDGRLRTPLIGWVSFQGAHDAGWISGVDQDADPHTIARRGEEGDWWASPQAQRLLRQLALAQAEA